MLFLCFLERAVCCVAGAVDCVGGSRCVCVSVVVARLSYVLVLVRGWFVCACCVWRVMCVYRVSSVCCRSCVC